MPSRAFIQKYQDQFPDKDSETTLQLQLQTVHELDLMKFSGDPTVREQFFQVFATCVPQNLTVLKMLNEARL